MPFSAFAKLAQEAPLRILVMVPGEDYSLAAAGLLQPLRYCARVLGSERLVIKEYLGSAPSRYYLELRLNKARQLLTGSHQSMVQIGLSCGFSSGAHFSTAYSGFFGMTPREERQKKCCACARRVERLNGCPILSANKDALRCFSSSLRLRVSGASGHGQACLSAACLISTMDDRFRAVASDCLQFEPVKACAFLRKY